MFWLSKLVFNIINKKIVYFLLENSNEGHCLLIAVIYFQKKDECVK